MFEDDLARKQGTPSHQTKFLTVRRKLETINGPSSEENRLLIIEEQIWKFTSTSRRNNHWKLIIEEASPEPNRSPQDLAPITIEFNSYSDQRN